MITNQKKNYIKKYSVSGVDDFLEIKPFHKLVMEYYGNDAEKMMDGIEEIADSVGEFGAIEEILSVVDGNYSIDIVLDESDNFDNDYAVIYVLESAKYFQEM